MVQYRLNLKMNDTRATNSYKLFNVKVVVSATLRSVARDSCSMFIVCILHKSATMVDTWKTVVPQDTIIFVLCVLSKQFVIATIVKSQH